jgi:hypothetical protein
MFERYTEKARRAIFFARYEASQCGSKAVWKLRDCVIERKSGRISLDLNLAQDAANFWQSPDVISGSYSEIT